MTKEELLSTRIGARLTAHLNGEHLDCILLEHPDENGDATVYLRTEWRKARVNHLHLNLLTLPCRD